MIVLLYNSLPESQYIHWTFYSATSILKKCRKVVLEKWFFKLGFFFLVNTFLKPGKMLIYGIKPSFFSGQPLFSNQISWTRFLEPLFHTFLEKWLQNKWSNGWRFKGRLLYLSWISRKLFVCHDFHHLLLELNFLQHTISRVFFLEIQLKLEKYFNKTLECCENERIELFISFW